MLRDRYTRWSIILMATYAMGVLPSLGQSLLESHAHRQTQTAYTAVLFAERGIDLLRPPLPIFGPPGIVPWEFPLFQGLASLVMDVGVGADLALRLTGLLCFLACATLLFWLARRAAGDVAAIVALAAFLFNGHAWIYGRTSLIEYLAVAGGLGFLLFTTRWMDHGRPQSWAAAAVAGAIGMSVKITTGGFYLLPILLWRSPSGRWGYQQPSVLLLIAVSLVAGGAWSVYSDAVRASIPATEFLATENQYGWLFGTLAQRFDLANWRVPLVALLTLTGSGLVIWALLAVREVRALPQRAFLAALLFLVALVPMVLFNLYAIHDYYFAVVAPPIALSIGLGAQWLRRNIQRPRARLMAAGLATAWVATIIGTFPSWSIIYGTPSAEPEALRVASFIREHSDADDWVVLDGYGWNATFFYYARRQGFALPDELTVQDTSNLDLDAILVDPAFGPFITCVPGGACQVTGER